MSTEYRRYIYWVPAEIVGEIRQNLKLADYSFNPPVSSQCKALITAGKKLGYLSPGAFNRVCSRQGSWYRNSGKAGMHAIVSDHRLPGELDSFLDIEMTESDFKPEALPDKASLQALVDADTYKNGRPVDWEKPTFLDAVLFKTMFTFNGFWGWGDNLKSSWLNHRANHANFLTKTYTTEIDGEQVPYTVSENSDVCSSCAEFFNVVSEDSRKLVRACPGSITLADVKRDVYYDIKPVRFI